MNMRMRSTIYVILLLSNYNDITHCHGYTYDIMRYYDNKVAEVVKED